MAKKKSKEARAQAVAMEWEKYMGQGDLADWQRLMRDLGFQEEFPSKTQCRKTLKKGVWVNIPDFLDATKAGRQVRLFGSQRELAAYTQATKRIFPKRLISKDSPLRQLLAHIF
ncbi:hypothetical protein F5Y14DRAFT_456208 [Nemania sp. NC0429]|nr:hypothetical protein F5Y14DRAFT_456208 [Nemania sp. NC0429]